MGLEANTSFQKASCGQSFCTMPDAKSFPCCNVPHFLKQPTILSTIPISRLRQTQVIILFSNEADVVLIDNNSAFIQRNNQVVYEVSCEAE